MAKSHKEHEDKNQSQIKKGIEIIRNNEILSSFINYNLHIVGRNELGRKAPACSKADGGILLNREIYLAPKQWAFAIAHCILHNCFGHYDLDKVPGYYEEDDQGNKRKIARFNKKLWNIACDIYVDRFLHEIKIGDPINESPVGVIPAGVMEDELKLYDYLLTSNWDEDNQIYGVGALDYMDMMGLENPIEYQEDWRGYNSHNYFASSFAYNLAKSVSNTISNISEHKSDNSFGKRISTWFINHFPLLGAIAASFEIVDDVEECRRYDISLAAVNPWDGIIYINSSKKMSESEWHFVMAHEFLHAALLHHRRSAGRDPYLWNIATDFVINGWLYDMQVGTMPEGVLYDPELKSMSAEEIYDMICRDMRTYLKMNTFRGNGQGDIMGKGTPNGFGRSNRNVDLDEFYKNALSQGLEYELGRGRGLIPAGLIEEIRALAVPPIPWDVKLAEWFNAHVAPLEKHRSYAHPSRRQSSTPDIPRPRYVPADTSENSRTFGVIIDTSGSMSENDIGKALGAVASYASSRDVLAARVVFCDASAYDAGYMVPEDIAGRVKVIGRGGTMLQPGIDLLQNAKDFPKKGPILIITDGEIESHLDINRDYAFILPTGCRLPFKAKDVFQM